MSNDTATITTLTHEQQIKIPGAIWIDKITVHTDHWVEGDWETLEHYNNRNKCVVSGVCPPFALHHGCTISDNYPGKDAKIARDKANFESAVEVTAGEVVEIEGRRYTVKINGLRYSDPLTFIPA